MDTQRSVTLDDTLGVHARVGHDSKDRSLVPPPTDSVYNYGERPSNDTGWKFGFLAIFLTTTLFGFVALAVEGATKEPGFGSQLCAQLDADIALSYAHIGEAMPQAKASVTINGGVVDGVGAQVRAWFLSQGIHLLWLTGVGAMVLGAALVGAASHLPHFSVFACVGIIVALPLLLAMNALAAGLTTPGYLLLAITAVAAYSAHANRGNLTLCAELFQCAAEVGRCRLNPVFASTE